VLGGMSALSRVATGLRSTRRRLLGRLDGRTTAAIVLPLGEESSNWIARVQFDLLRRRGCNAALEASPHVTLKLGFRVPELEPLAEWLERLAREVPPIELTLRDVGRFDEGILYLGVVPTPQLGGLRQRILRDLRTEFGIRPGEIEDDRFKFHATLTSGLPRDVLDAEHRALGTAAVEFHETSRFLALWAYTGTHWVTYRRAPLSGRADV
jgi:2'-5' RNA ligase